jgi:hypothetical protein
MSVSKHASKPDENNALQQELQSLDAALRALEAATSKRLNKIALAESQLLDADLLNADRQKLAQALDDEKAARILSEKLRLEALEKVDKAFDLVQGSLYAAKNEANQ